MSGEVPTEQTDSNRVRSTIAFARNLLEGDVRFDPTPDDVDAALLDTYVAIDGLFKSRGRHEEIEAADIIASYWQGEVPPDLRQCVQGSYSSAEGQEIYRRAIHFTEAGTVNDPEARKHVRRAHDLLWRDQSR